MNIDQEYQEKLVTLLNGSISSTSYNEAGDRIDNGKSVSVKWNPIASANVKRGHLIIIDAVAYEEPEEIGVRRGHALVVDAAVEQEADIKSTKKTSSKKSTETVEEPIQEQTTPVEETKEEIVEEVSSDSTEVPEESVE